MWKKIKKNEIVIYAIALMLVTAGYLNYTANVEKEVEVASNSLVEEEKKSDQNEEDKNIGEATLVNSNEVVEEKEDADDKKENTEKINNVADTNNTNNAENEEEIEAAKEVASQAEDYFVATKLERTTNYATMISNYTKILEDKNINEKQKTIAMEEIKKINNTKSAIDICENLLQTKGFINSVILVNDDSVNIVVKTEGGLQAESVAQIQNIISRELKIKIENIHISEKE